MENEKNVPGKIVSMAKMKCPNCHQGDMYVNKSIFPLKSFMEMPTHCPHCGLKFELETGFWFGTGYVSYGMSVGLIFTMAVIFGLTYGFTWKDNSILIFVVLMIAALILLQPWIMRYARVNYIYFFVNYKDKEFKNLPK